MEIKMLHSDLGHLNFVIFKAIVAMLSFVLRKLLWLVIKAEWILTARRTKVRNSAEIILEPVLPLNKVLILFWRPSIVTKGIILLLLTLLCLSVKVTIFLLSRLFSLLTCMSRKTLLRTWWGEKIPGGVCILWCKHMLGSLPSFFLKF